MEHFCRNAALKTTSMKRQTFNCVEKGDIQTSISTDAQGFKLSFKLTKIEDLHRDI